jgi:hypothetical protein
VEACTITAPDVITAFAAPNPNCSSQSQSVFSGLAVLQVALPNLSPNLLRIGKFYLNQPFRSSTVRKLNALWIVVNAAFRCKPRLSIGVSLTAVIDWQVDRCRIGAKLLHIASTAFTRKKFPRSGGSVAERELGFLPLSDALPALC